MYQHFVSSWCAGLRSHSLRVVGVVAVLLMVLAHLAGSFSARQPHTVELDVGLSGSRIVLALLAIFWVQELVSKELDRRTVYFALAYPEPRASYWLGRYLGIALLLLVSVVFLGGALYVLVTFGGSEYQQAHPVEFGSTFLLVMMAQWLDSLVIAAFCMLIASLATTALMPLAMGLAFAFIARSYGVVLALVADPNGGFADMAAQYLPLLKLLGYVVPDLSALDLRESVLYRRQLVELAIGGGVAKVCLYLATLLAASVSIFNRREFL